MNTPSGINTGFQLCDGSDSEGEVKDASISPTLSHAEAPESQKFSRIANDGILLSNDQNNFQQSASAIVVFSLICCKAAVMRKRFHEPC